MQPDTNLERPTKTTHRFSVSLMVAVICLLGLALRLWGIRWGLPVGLRQGSYHPDELLIIGAASAVDISSFQLNPHFYNYPSLYIYAVSILFRAADSLGVLHNAQIADLYVLARTLTAIFGAATIPVVFLTANKLYGKKAGLIAALTIAVLPIHVQYSHYVAVDVPAVFFVAAALAASMMLLRDCRLRVFLLAGALAGLATGTKYNCGLIILSVITAGLLTQAGPHSIGRKLSLTLSALIAAAICFLISTPGAILWPAQFIHGLTFEIGHAASGHGYVFTNTGPGWLYAIKSSLAGGVGWLFLAVAFLSVVASLFRRRRDDFVVLAFVVPYYILISVSEVRFARYVLPLFPPLALLTGAFISELLKKRSTTPVLRIITTLIIVAVAGYTLAYSVALDRLFTQKDPRDRVAAWANSYLPKGTTIAFPTIPWFYSPPFSPGFGSLDSSARYESMSKSKYALLTDKKKEWNVELLRKHRPEYIMISDYEKVDALRANAPGARQYKNFVSKKYEPVAVFESRLSPPVLRSTLLLPHDMRYPAPRIEVYRLKWQK